MVTAMSQANEILQWAVLAVLAVFVFGLTRQLGLFIVPRQQQLAEAGPPTGRRVPRTLVSTTDAVALSELIERDGRGGAVLVVIDEDCTVCTDLTEELAAARRSGLDEDPSLLPIGAIVKQSSPGFTAKVGGTYSVTIPDPEGRKTSSAGIIATPFIIVVDRRLRVQYRAVGPDVYGAISAWRANSNGPPATTPTKLAGRSLGRPSGGE
jgi:hypothetical protein